MGGQQTERGGREVESEKIEDGFFVLSIGNRIDAEWGPFVLREQAEECVIMLAGRVDVSGVTMEWRGDDDG